MIIMLEPWYKDVQGASDILLKENFRAISGKLQNGLERVLYASLNFGTSSGKVWISVERISSGNATHRRSCRKEAKRSTSTVRKMERYREDKHRGFGEEYPWVGSINVTFRILYSEKF